jgi:hypothetical protein
VTKVHVALADSNRDGINDVAVGSGAVAATS